ncbi:MAG TPA: GNAT family N-acetyltransferase [Solirubrobacteraceae bacterium]
MTATEVCRAAPEDLEEVTETLWLAFGADPLWRWAFPDHAQLRPLWRLHVASALKHEWVWTIGDGAAAAVWIPPGRTELTPEAEAGLPALVRELAGERAGAVLELFERFDGCHPDGPPHYYLSLLGTHPERRGEGLGMRLLAENLRLIDAEGAPAYLESSNPANEQRYESVGFRRTGSFTTPDGAREVATMWREPGDGSP